MEYKGGVARRVPGQGLSLLLYSPAHDGEHRVGAPGMPAAVTVFNFLLYSPAHDGGHIKWPPVRAELATN